MAVEYIRTVKRTLYVATCPKCSNRVGHTEKIAKERFCFDCKEWVPFVEESYTGPEIGK